MADFLPKLPLDAYQTDAITLARRLLGCKLYHRTAEGVTGGIIVETEAYLGLQDDAAHSYRGSPDGRVNIQYGPGGFSYIYLIYGMHNCMNVVANAPQIPEAVLIRALQPTDGLSLMRARRPKAKPTASCAPARASCAPPLPSPGPNTALISPATPCGSRTAPPRRPSPKVPASAWSTPKNAAKSHGATPSRTVRGSASNRKENPNDRI